MSLLDTASLIVTPNAYKASKLYSVVPSNGNGDFTVTRATTATRTNSSGLIESVASNIPRLDYSNATCPSLLLEPQRTNSILNSATGTNQTVIVGNVSYTISFYGSGTVALSGTHTASVVGLGTTRKTYTFTPTSGILIVNITGTVTNIQLEAGAYASSYIPTTTASVTRNYDFLFLGNNYTSGRISASGGTWFTYLINNIPITRDSGGGVGLRLSNTTFNNTLHISTPGGSNQRYWIRKIVGGTNTNLYHTLTNEVKIAIKWNGTTADVFVNGVKVVSATAFTSVDLENLGLDNGNIPYNINSMALWSTPLTDTQLAQLTTI